MATISDKIREQRGAVEQISAEAQLVRSRISELEQILAEKEKRQKDLDMLLAKEAELLAKLA